MTDSVAKSLWAEAASARPAANNLAIWMEVAHSVETTDAPAPKLQPIMTIALVVLPVLEEEEP